MSQKKVLYTYTYEVKERRESLWETYIFEEKSSFFVGRV